MILTYIIAIGLVQYLGIGDWGLGIGLNPQFPILNPLKLNLTNNIRKILIK